jgi:hypothetical protein
LPGAAPHCAGARRKAAPRIDFPRSNEPSGRSRQRRPVNNVWSLTSDERGGAYNNFLMQPFINYNFAGGTYIGSTPIVTANWKEESSQRWTVPLGLSVGHIFHLGRLPVNAQIGGYYNVIHPDNGPNWQLRLQVQLLFPK